MKATKSQIIDFKNTVCPNCYYNCDKEESIINCPKLFNYIIYKDTEGKCPETKEFLSNLKKK